MIPALNITQIGQPIKTGRLPTITHGLHFVNDTVVGYVDGVQAMEQAIYKILLTERYQYVIYNWDYGIELADLFGKTRAYVYPELKRRITEALKQDDRILEVDNFVFSAAKRDVVELSFTAHTIFGDFSISGGVRV